MSEALAVSSVAVAQAVPEDTQLPPLREDLGLFPGPRNSRGEASWMLHDPVRNRYFRLGVAEFEMLARWQAAGKAGALVALAARDGVSLSLLEVQQFSEFLYRCELTQGDQGVVKRLAAAHHQRQRSLWSSLLHNYLFFRLPLVRPDPLLDRLYPLLRPLLSHRFLQATVFAGLLSLFLVVRQWDLFLSTFMGFLNWEGAAAFGVSLVLVKVLHEAGHALACRHYGLRVPTIGVVFIVMWPVMYTDATEAWRLTSRRARIAIAAAGMLTELSIACYATLLWVVLPDGVVRSAVFMLATTTWVMSLAVNLNPLMKFDGYYLFSDILDIPNLQDRGFALARNQMRHVLFGVGRVRDPGLTPAEHRIAIAWAYATWIYRFFLFLGIALLVYTFFFKALGIFLFLVEIWWFIAAPIWREVKGWRELAAGIDPRRRRLALFGGGALLLLLLVPWQSAFLVPGVMKGAEHQRLYPVEPARLVALHVDNGSRVARGAPLFELESPDLEAQLASTRAELDSAENDLLRIMSSARTSQDRLVAEESVAKARAALAGLEGRLARQRIVAPFDGVISDIPPMVRRGLWVGDKQSLGVVVGERGGVVVDAYVTEQHLRFIAVGDKVRFYPDNPGDSPQDGVVERVDSVDTRILPDPYLSATHGGGIDVRRDADGNQVPERAVYRIRAKLDARVQDVPQRVVRGKLRLEGDPRSLAQRAWTFLGGAVLRESGF